MLINITTNEVSVFSIKYRYNDILLKNINFIYSVDKTFRVFRIMDFNINEPTCYSSSFPYASSGYQNTAFSYIVISTTPYIHPRIDSKI